MELVEKPFNSVLPLHICLKIIISLVGFLKADYVGIICLQETHKANSDFKTAFAKTKNSVTITKPTDMDLNGSFLTPSCGTIVSTVSSSQPPPLVIP